MVTKNQINLIRQIKRKRNRKEKKLFIVEGKKSIDEFLKSDYELFVIYSTNPKEISSDKIIKIASAPCPQARLALPIADCLLPIADCGAGAGCPS